MESPTSDYVSLRKATHVTSHILRGGPSKGISTSFRLRRRANRTRSTPRRVGPLPSGLVFVSVTNETFSRATALWSHGQLLLATHCTEVLGPTWRTVISD